VTLTVVAWAVAGWLVLVGTLGIVRSQNLVQTVVALSVAQSGTYVLLIAAGFQRGATVPILGAGGAGSSPVVQAMVLTDVVVSATVTALLLALTVQIAKRHGTVDPDQLRELRG
jgi:multicomponent Na+:H+ antiporter subunit C